MFGHHIHIHQKKLRLLVGLLAVNCKLMVDLIVDLPIAPLAGILTAWLHSREVIRLDSAYCNKRYRPLLLQTLTASYAVQHAVLIATGRHKTISYKKRRYSMDD